MVIFHSYIYIYIVRLVYQRVSQNHHCGYDLGSPFHQTWTEHGQAQVIRRWRKHVAPVPSWARPKVIWTMAGWSWADTARVAFLLVNSGRYDSHGKKMDDTWWHIFGELLEKNLEITDVVLFFNGVRTDFGAASMPWFSRFVGQCWLIRRERWQGWPLITFDTIWMGVMHVQLCTSYCFVRTRGLITFFLTHSYPFLIPDGSFPTKLIVDYPHYLTSRVQNLEIMESWVRLNRWNMVWKWRCMYIYIMICYLCIYIYYVHIIILCILYVHAHVDCPMHIPKSKLESHEMWFNRNWVPWFWF